MTLLEKLRLAFLARTRREKMLSVAFLVAISALWLVLYIDRWGDFAPELSRIREQAREDANWLALEPGIAVRYQDALESLRSDSINGARAYSTIDQIARASGMDFKAPEPVPNKREQLTFYPINVNITKGDYFQLKKFYQDVVNALPTVKLDEVTIGAPDRTGAVLSAQFKFVAIEINQ